jgi:outer membrane lipoprotein SlyB
MEGIMQFMSNVRTAGIGALLLAATLAAGCAPSIRGDTYQRGQAMNAQSVELGVVDSLRPVQIEGRQSGAGVATGAVIGGLGGSQVGGSSSAHVAGAIVGALIGGAIGNAVERDATKANGVEITVRLDSGRMLAIVQEGSMDEFRPGDRIRVLSDGYMTRVSR